MAMPGSEEARLYYRCAFQRYDDAEILLRAGHTTGAVYLAGYSIECILKALVLANLKAAARSAMLSSFRGAKAHDYEWLRVQYLRSGGAPFPRAIADAFTLVTDWSTDIRYLPRTLDVEEAEGFKAATQQIIRWADGRL